MVTPAYTRKTDFFLLYYVVKEYLSLPYQKRFRVGMRADFINFTHAELDIDELDELVIRKMIQLKQMDHFVRIMQVVRYESY